MAPSFQTARLEEILREQLPLARFMDVRVERWDEEGLTLTAGEEPNVNLQGSMFGGSIAALGLLAGWGLVRLALREEGIEPEVVVQRTITEYARPVTGASVATALTPAPGDWARFLRALRRRKRGRILLEIHVRGAESTAPDTIMDAWFVAVDQG